MVAGAGEPLEHLWEPDSIVRMASLGCAWTSHSKRVSAGRPQRRRVALGGRQQLVHARELARLDQPFGQIHG